MKLDEITLIAYDNTSKPERTAKVLEHCQKFFEFPYVLLVCSVKPENYNGRIFLVNEEGYQAAQSFEAYRINQFVPTEYCMYVSHDGYILNPDKWDDSWLQYDFIGAPWPSGITYSEKYRVGNNGFCLESKRFIELCAKHWNQFKVGWPSDVWSCQIMRPAFESLGIKYAPLEVAAGFSWEHNIREIPGERHYAFGFHDFGGKSIKRL